MKELILGHLSVAERIWTAAAPALVLIAYIVIGLVVYLARHLTRGAYRDAEAEAREGGGLTVKSVRVFFSWLVRPWVDALVRFEVPPNAITSLSLALSLASGVALAMGRFALGGWLYVAAGACDFLDGKVARQTGRATPGGAVLDSVLDRCSEAAVLVGLAWFYRDRWVLAPVLVALVGSLLVPYVRARGEAIGAKLSDVGFMQRPERVFVLSVTVSLSPVLEALVSPRDPRPMHWIAVAGIAVLAVGALVTSVTRTAHLMRSLEATTRAQRQSVRAPTRRPRVFAGLAALTGMLTDYAVLHAVMGNTPTPAPIASMASYAAGATIGLLILGIGAKGPLPHAGTGQGWWVFAVGSGALLCAGGVAILGLVPGFSAPLAWLAVRLVVFFTWTRPLMGNGVRARMRRQLTLERSEG